MVNQGIYDYKKMGMLYMMNFCTLFDSNYLDKGLALYESLNTVTSDFTLFIFSFDQKAYEILKSMDLKHAVILSNSCFEDKQLLKLKEERTKAEYCWTCTPISIEYVLNNYDVNSCTYIDADMYFFSNPQILFDEIEQANANIVITPHRFAETLSGRRYLNRSGKYCVEFNYFDQSENSRKALTWWKYKCLEWCFHIYEPDRMGDQKYLEQFPKKFKGVYELKNLGGGTAPWNLGQYSLLGATNNDIELIETKNGEQFRIVFYHFQNIRYIDKHTVNIGSGTHSKKLKYAIYIPYLRHIESVRKQLGQYGIVFNAEKVCSSNRIMAFWQKYLIKYRIKSFSDVISIRE